LFQITSKPSIWRINIRCRF